jgi:predicted CXXCH cytochrome family protein
MRTPGSTRARAIAPALIVALAACAGAKPEPGRVADAAAPPRTAFETYPDAEIAGVKNPHQYKGKALCQRCHAADLKLTRGAIALCLECHRFPYNNHPVDVAPKQSPATLPLLAGGKVACHTCHDPHQSKVVLRKKFNELCLECHKRH